MFPLIPRIKGAYRRGPLDDGATIPYTDPCNGEPLGELTGVPSKDS